MKPLSGKAEVAFFWVPIGGVLILTAIAGGQIHAASDMPASLSPGFFLCGAMLIIGAMIGVLEPVRLRRFLCQPSGQPLSVALQYLFSLGFGVLIVSWALMAGFRHAV